MRKRASTQPGSSPSRRGKPRRKADSSPADASARERILAAADELFYRNGITAVGIDSIIARAGVAKMSLYNHFSSKDELAAEVARRRDERWFNDFLSAVNARGSGPCSRILAVFDVARDWHARPDFSGCAFLNIAAEFRSTEHPARLIAREHHERLRAFFCDLARQAGAHDAESLGDQLAILLAGSTLWATFTRRTEHADRARDAAAKLLDASLSPE